MPACFTGRHVERGLEILDAHNGEIWAKLESGTDEYYQLVERTPIPFRRMLDNIASAAKRRPLVIQACSCESTAICRRLRRSLRFAID